MSGSGRMTDLEAVGYVADSVLTKFGLTILIESVWKAAQKRERERVCKIIDMMTKQHNSMSSHGRAKITALKELREEIWKESGDPTA